MNNDSGQAVSHSPRNYFGEALDGLSVLEVGDGVATPYTGKLLGDAGADVLRLELKLEPASSDAASELEPLTLFAGQSRESAFYSYLNERKRVVAVGRGRMADLRDAIIENAARADIIIHDKPPSVAHNLGLSTEQLWAVNRKLVVTAVTPFGSEGPYAEWHGTNSVVSHFAGVSRKTTWQGMEWAHSAPRRPAGYYADFMGGVAGAVASLGALFARDVQGIGQFADVSSAEATYLTSFPLIMYPAYEGNMINFRAAGPKGVLQGREPMRYMACKDGFIWLAVLQPRHWRQLLDVLDLPKLATDERFSSPLARGRAWNHLEPLLNSRLRQWKRDELFHACQENGIPVVPAYTVREAVELSESGVADFLEVLDRREGEAAPLVGPRNPCRLYSDPSRRGTGKTSTASAQGPTNSALPLANVRVLDLSWVLAAPLSTQMLRRLGAEVIRIESDTVIDISRASPPFADSVENLESSGYFSAINVGKKTATVDLRSPSGVQLIKDLVASSDIVVENFSPGTLERMGLGYGVLKGIKEDVILLSISAFGQNGRMRAYRAYGLQLFALSGLSVLSSPEDAPPAVLQGGGADPLAAHYAAYAALAALRRRDQSGLGGHVDVSMFDVTMAHMADAVLAVTSGGDTPGPVGNREVPYAPSGCYECSGEDEWLAMSVRSTLEWRELCDVIGRSDLAERADLSTAAGRSSAGDEIDVAISTWTASISAYDAMNILQARSIAAAISSNDVSFASDPQIVARRFFQMIDHREYGRRASVTVPWLISGVDEERLSDKVPKMNEFADYVTGSVLGLSAEETYALEDEHVIPQGARASATSS